MIPTPEYTPSLRSSIASHGSDLFGDRPFVDYPSALGLELTNEPHQEVAPSTISTNDSDQWQRESPRANSSPLSSRDPLAPLEHAAASYFDPRPPSELPSSLPPSLPRSARERDLKRLSLEVEPHMVTDSTLSPVRVSSRPPSVASRPPSIVLSRPHTPYRSISRASSRPRSLAEEIADIGEEVPQADSDDSDEDVSWAAILNGGREASRSSEGSFDRQRTAFPPPRSRTSSISARSVSGSRLPSRTPSLRSSFSAVGTSSPLATPPLTPDSRPRVHTRHSFHIDQLGNSPAGSLAPPSPNDDRIAPKRANSISGLPSFRALRSFRSNRRSSGKAEANVINITVPHLTSSDLPSPVPELPNEPDDGSTLSSVNSRSPSLRPRRSAPITPTRKPRITLPKMPKVFKKSGSHPSPKIITTIETSEEIAPNGDWIERTCTTTRRPRAASRVSYSSQVSNPSPDGSTPATPGTPDQYVENNPLQYVVNVSPTPAPTIIAPKPIHHERKTIKPIMILDYGNPVPTHTYTAPATPSATPSRPTAPGPPVRSAPSTPATVVAAEGTAAPPVAATVESKTHITAGNATIDISTPVAKSSPAPTAPTAPTVPTAESSPAATVPAPLASTAASSPAETVPAPPASIGNSEPAAIINIDPAKGAAEVIQPPPPNASGSEADKADTADKVDKSDKAGTADKAGKAAPTTINIDAAKGSVEVKTGAHPPTSDTASVKEVAKSSSESKVSPESAKDLKAEPTKSPNTASKSLHNDLQPVRSKSPSPSLRALDARVNYTSSGSEVVVSLTSQRYGHAEPKSDAGSHEEKTERSEKNTKEVANHKRETAEAPHTRRPQFVKHHSADSARNSNINTSRLQSKRHSLESHFAHSHSYDHLLPAHLNSLNTRSRGPSRRNSEESIASQGTDSGVRKRRILNPMSLDFSSSESSDDDIEIEYKETDDALDVKIRAKVPPALMPKTDDVDSDDGLMSRDNLRKRIQTAERLMKENPRLPSDIDDVPMHHFPAPPTSLPQPWVRPGHPSLRPLYLGGRAFGAPVSTMMPGLGYANHVGHGYLGGQVPMFRPPGWYPRPRP